ncbi:MAG: MFS transporter [Alphaproteobacteria bacterium]|nr:MFS transporter [Alphaproteobacteria bacterium]
MTKFSGWKIEGALCSIYFLALGINYYGFVAILPAMIVDQGWSRGDATIGFSFVGAVAGLGSPFAAMCIRRIGARNTIIAGGVVNALGALITYSTHSLLQYYVGIGFFMALGITLQTLVPGSTVLTNWFLRRRALAMGLFLSMGGLGGFVASMAFGYFVKVTGDWRGVFLIMICTALLASLVAYLFVHNQPGDVGQFQDGVDASLPPETQGLKPKKSNIETSVYPWTMREAIRTRAYWVIVGAFTVALMGYYIGISQAPIYLELDRGMDPLIAKSALAAVLLISTLGRFSGGLLGDHFQPRYLLTAGLVMVLIGMVLLNYSDAIWQVYAFAILLGFGYGLAYLSLPTLMANYFGGNDYARILGAVYFVSIPLGALAPVLAGYTFDLVHSYTAVFLGFAALAVIPAAMTLMARPPSR